MRKKEDRKDELVDLLNEFLKTGDENKITQYLISHSNLPGPRGNLELAQQFSEVIEEFSSKEPERLWNLCLRLTEISPDEAPVNDPKEFLPFCGTCGIGAIGSVSSAHFQKALSRLRALAKDSRWRVREAVANGIQELIRKQERRTLRELEDWIERGNWLQMRAATPAA